MYLHSLNLVHGDVKGTNILVRSTGRACLADFGLSTFLGDNVWPSSGPGLGCSRGTARWRAPELFLHESVEEGSTPTPASDVYSFACVAYEVLTGQIPFYEIKQEDAISLAKLSDSCPIPRRPRPEEASQELTGELWCFLEDCWNYEPEGRPSIDEALRRLEGMMIPEQLQVVKSGDPSVKSSCDVVPSSSQFRKSFSINDQTCEDDLLKVIAMASTWSVIYSFSSLMAYLGPFSLISSNFMDICTAFCATFVDSIRKPFIVDKFLSSGQN